MKLKIPPLEIKSTLVGIDCGCGCGWDLRAMHGKQGQLFKEDGVYFVNRTLFIYMGRYDFHPKFSIGPIKTKSEINP